MIRTIVTTLVVASSLTVVGEAQTYSMRAKMSPTTTAATTPAPAPSATCGLPQQTFWYSGGTQNNLPRTASPAAAQTACNGFLAANPGQTGICLWNPANGASTGSTYVMTGATMVRNSGQYRNELYASTCQ